VSSLERVVEKLIEVRAVKCPYCGLKNTVKNPRWKHVKCKGCGHKINVPFSEQYIEEVVERVVVREENAVRRLTAMPLPFHEIEG